MDTTRLSERHVMVKEQLEKRGIQNPWVLQAMLDIPRHFFLPDEQHLKAYEDRPIPIGHGQTASQRERRPQRTAQIHSAPERIGRRRR